MPSPSFVDVVRSRARLTTGSIKGKVLLGQRRVGRLSRQRGSDAPDNVGLQLGVLAGGAKRAQGGQRRAVVQHHAHAAGVARQVKQRAHGSVLRGGVINQRKHVNNVGNFTQEQGSAAGLYLGANILRLQHKRRKGGGKGALCLERLKVNVLMPWRRRRPE